MSEPEIDCPVCHCQCHRPFCWNCAALLPDVTRAEEAVRKTLNRSVRAIEWAGMLLLLCATASATAPTPKPIRLNAANVRPVRADTPLRLSPDGLHWEHTIIFQDGTRRKYIYDLPTLRP